MQAHEYTDGLTFPVDLQTLGTTQVLICLSLLDAQIYDLEMDTQLAYFQNTITSLQRELGSSQAVRELLADSLFIIIIGSNDYLNNYLLPLSIRSNLSAPTYRNLLISNLRRQLTV